MGECGINKNMFYSLTCMLSSDGNKDIVEDDDSLSDQLKVFVEFGKTKMSLETNKEVIAK